MTLIMGVDPGGTTGAALIEWNCALPISSENVTLRQTWELPFEDFPAWADTWIPRVDYLAVERYLITGRTVTGTRQYEAMYVIGGLITLTALVSPITAPDIVMNTAANAKNAWTNDRLAAAGFADATRGSRHARDALRHALLCCHTLTK